MSRALRRTLLRAPLLIWLLTAFGGQAQAAGRVECSAVKSAILARPVRYCALLPPSYESDPRRQFPVLYHLHGLGDNEQSLINFGGWSLLEDLQAKKKIGEFIVIAPAGSTTFYINSRDRKMRYEDFFLREFLPAVERKYRVKPGRAARAIGGVSMGGYGALRFAFKHPEMFTSVAVHSAALMSRLPEGLTSASGVGGLRINVLGPAFGQPVDQKYFEQNNVFTFARQSGARLRRLKIYLDCGTSDDFGFYEGARELHELLEKLKVPHEFHLYPGGHNWQYVAEHLDESFEFQSRALGAK